MVFEKFLEKKLGWSLHVDLFWQSFYAAESLLCLNDKKVPMLHYDLRGDCAILKTHCRYSILSFDTRQCRQRNDCEKFNHADGIFNFALHEEDGQRYRLVAAPPILFSATRYLTERRCSISAALCSCTTRAHESGKCLPLMLVTAELTQQGLTAMTRRGQRCPSFFAVTGAHGEDSYVESVLLLQCIPRSPGTTVRERECPKVPRHPSYFHL